MLVPSARLPTTTRQPRSSFAISRPSRRSRSWYSSTGNGRFIHGRRSAYAYDTRPQPYGIAGRSFALTTTDYTTRAARALYRSAARPGRRGGSGFEPRPAFHQAEEFRVVQIDHVLPGRGRPRLPHPRSQEHRHAQLVGQVEADVQVLDVLADGEPRVEPAGQEIPGDLRLRRVAAARGPVDRREQPVGGEPRPRAQHVRFHDAPDGRRREEVVDGLGGVTVARGIADVDHLPEAFQDRPAGFQHPGRP